VQLVVAWYYGTVRCDAMTASAGGFDGGVTGWDGTALSSAVVTVVDGGGATSRRGCGDGGGRRRWRGRRRRSRWRRRRAAVSTVAAKATEGRRDEAFGRVVSGVRRAKKVSRCWGVMGAAARERVVTQLVPALRHGPLRGEDMMARAGGLEGGASQG
jgi:hypothetical protein